jgi:hypothetical protein
MVAFLAGGVAGSVLSAKVYAAAGWGACSALAFALIALLASRSRRRRAWRGDSAGAQTWARAG